MKIDHIIAAVKGQRKIGQTSMQERETAIREMLSFAYQMKGKVITEDQFLLMCPPLEFALSHSYQYLTLPEVRIAVDAGIAGEYPTIGNRVDATNVLAWVACYAKSADRADALKVLEIRENAATKAAKDAFHTSEAARLNAECFQNEPGRAFRLYCKEGREGFATTQYLSNVIYAAMRSQIKEFYDTLIDKGKRLAIAKQRATERMRKDVPRLFRVGGVNAADLDSFYKSELVFDYFDHLKQNNLTIN